MANHFTGHSPSHSPSHSHRISELAKSLADMPPVANIGELAIKIASLHHPHATTESAIETLAGLARACHDVAQSRADSPHAADRAEILANILAEQHGFHGDAETYDDLANADFIAVLERRHGLPVSLGILYLHCARACGWHAAGIAFPGHFMIRLDGDDGRVILDPFNAGRIVSPPELRRLLKIAEGLAAELQPSHYMAVPDGEVLLRLQNNIKLRQLAQGNMTDALDTLGVMVLLAPHRASLWWETAQIAIRLNRHAIARTALETLLGLPNIPESTRHESALLLQKLSHHSEIS